MAKGGFFGLIANRSYGDDESIYWRLLV